MLYFLILGLSIGFIFGGAIAEHVNYPYASFWECVELFFQEIKGGGEE